MRKEIDIKEIGYVETAQDKYIIQIDPAFRPALAEIAGFSHLQILWWGHLCDTPELRHKLLLGQLFRNGPENVGSFATRSPVRPNPILVSIIMVSDIDQEKGTIATPFIDAEAGTPVLDVKPYMRMERVKNCHVPDWCSHWPRWQEDAAKFDWEAEIAQPNQKILKT